MSEKIIDRNKSNLNIKKYKRNKKQTNELVSTRKKEQKQKTNNVKIIFGLDNGTTGTICCMIPEINYIDFIQTPNKESIDYTQKIQYISRIDINKLIEWFRNNIKKVKQFYKNDVKSIVILQRPMVNPQRFKQSGHALRAFEATLITLETLNLNYIIIDSKKWQHYFFGKNTSQIDLKEESKKLGLTILQNNKNNQNEKEIEVMLECVKRHGDADGLLICKFGTDKLIKG